MANTRILQRPKAILDGCYVPIFYGTLPFCWQGTPSWSDDQPRGG